MRRKHKLLSRMIFSVFAFCLCLSFPLKAEDPLEQALVQVPSAPVLGASGNLVQPAGEMPASAAGAEVAKVEKTADGKYYLDFKAASLINVLNVLSNLSGINFVAGREVSDRQVNMTLDNVTLEDALQAISHGCNVSYDFLPGRNIYLFRASADSPEQPPLLTRVFKLYYVKVSKVKEIENAGGSSDGLSTLKGPEDGADQGSAIVKSVEKILSSRGKVSIDDRSNSLIVTDSEDRLKMIESAIVQLDRPLDQVLINVILVETFEDLDRRLGIEWGGDEGVFGTLTGAKEATEWPLRTGASNNGFFDNIGDTFQDTAKQFSPTHNTGAITTQGSRDFSSFQVTVRALEDTNKLKILAKPKILALDNQPALIKISTNAAIGSSTVTEAGGAGTSSSDTERYEIGTILRVTPLINTGGRITLTLEPTFATVETSAIRVSSVGGGETGDPTTRTARTTLMVNDGQTIALGGMLFSSQTNDDRKVPFFGNLPVIGKALFTSNTKSIKDRELILFVTPHIITDPAMLETPIAPDGRLSFDKEAAPFWKVKEKQWYKDLKDGKETKTDFDGYFNVRKKLIESTLESLDEGARASVPGA